MLFLGICLYWFSIAVITRYCELSRLKQHPFIISHFWRAAGQVGPLLGASQAEIRLLLVPGRPFQRVLPINKNTCIFSLPLVYSFNMSHNISILFSPLNTLSHLTCPSPAAYYPTARLCVLSITHQACMPFWRLWEGICFQAHSGCRLNSVPGVWK